MGYFPNRYFKNGNPFKRALLLRLGIAMASITGLAFAGMLASVIIAGTTQGEGSAINQAGSLRMQAYKIASELAQQSHGDVSSHTMALTPLIKEFSERLASPRLTRIIPTNLNSDLRQAYNAISDHWVNNIHPELDHYLLTIADKGNYRFWTERQETSMKYQAFVNDFVNQIDALVFLLENDVESKMQLLSMLQGIILFLTIIIVSITMFMMQSEVLVPLKDLVNCAEHVRRSDFSVRPSYLGDDELGQLAHAFDFMAEDLSKLYNDLEHRVEQKTSDLERSNKSIQLLYNTTRRLSMSPLVVDVQNEILLDLERLAETGPGMVCLTKTERKNAKEQALHHTNAEWLSELCDSKKCKKCVEQASVQLVTSETGETLPEEVTAFRITDRDQQHGILFVSGKDGAPLVKWQIELIEIVAQTIGTALGIADKLTKNRRLVLLEERSVIARELHDSLAQSLGYIKIQVSRLQNTLRKPNTTTDAEDIAQDIRDGVGNAYQHLRELLTTFRLNLEGLGLTHALEATVNEFVERYSLHIELNNALRTRQLSPNEEVHILQIIREALSNVAHHAKANEVHINLRTEEDHSVSISISDNGIGIPENANRTNHYGLAIMEERARSLNGKLKILNGEEKGTWVQVDFVPQSNKSQRPAAQ